MTERLLITFTEVKLLALRFELSERIRKRDNSKISIEGVSYPIKKINNRWIIDLCD